MGSLNIMILKKLSKKDKILLFIGFILFIISTLYVSSHLMDTTLKYQLEKCVYKNKELLDYCKQELNKCNNPFENNEIIISGDFKNVLPK